jgi:F-type H+-transporting ATPase subunit delta
VEKKTIARPYAEAVFARAVETDQLDRWSAMLAFLAQLVTDERIAPFVVDPRFERGRLTRILLELGAGQLSTEGENFLRLLVENGRVEVVPEVCEIFEVLKSEREGKIEVNVISAYALNAAQKRELEAALERRFGRAVSLHVERDRSLIAGLVIRAGDVVIDGSVRGRLQQLAEALGATHA